MPSTLARRAVAAVAVSGTVLGGVALAGTGVASAHGRHARPTRIHTSLKVSVQRRTASGGAADTIFGHLQAAGGHRLADEQVVLQDKAPGSSTGWAQEASAKSGPRGNVAFPVTPTAKTDYRLVFTGTPNFRPSKSRTVVVGVRNTALSISASSTSVDPGTAVTIKGVLDNDGSPAAGQTVNLRDRIVGSHAKNWALVGSAPTGPDGSVSFTVTPTASTRYLLGFPGNGSLQPARSRVLTVVVRQSSSLSIRVVKAKKAYVISGDLRGGGHGLRHRPVSLLDRASSTAAWTVVATHRSGKTGFVSFRQKPTTTTEYELAFAGGRYYDGCTSGVVTVTVS